jgi:REP-associated tyrosine transposase
MARPPRIEFPGTIYYVIIRGNRLQDIFLEDQDRIGYLGRVRHYREECGFVPYVSALISNHVQLLLEKTKAPLSRIIP